MSISKPLDKFAKAILREAEAAPLEVKLEAFKLLTAYHIGVTKVRKDRPEATAEDTFRSLKDGIMAAEAAEELKQ